MTPEAVRNVAVAAALIAGLAAGLQAALGGILGRRIGALEASSFIGIAGALFITTALLVTGRSPDGLGEGFRQPVWLWIGGGIAGAIVVTTITFAPQRIGTFATLGLLIVGQLAAGALIDHLGLLGLERFPLSASRIAGLVLLAAGAVLVLRR